jgi:excisionase family DNA binding protein
VRCHVAAYTAAAARRAAQAEGQLARRRAILELTASPLLSVREVCEVMSISLNTARSWIASGRLQARKIGGRLWIPIAEIRRLRGEP